MRALGALAPLLLAVPVLASCGSASEGLPKPPPAAPDTAAPTSQAKVYDEATYGPRVELPGGLLLKQPGKVAEYNARPGSDVWAVRVVVDRIDVDPACDDGKADPERGHRVVVTVSVQTSPDYDDAVTPPPAWYQWTTTGLDGVSEAAMSTYHACHDADVLPTEMRPAAKYAGEVTLDTTNPSGMVVLGDKFAWEY